MNKKGMSAGMIIAIIFLISVLFVVLLNGLVLKGMNDSINDMLGEIAGWKNPGYDKDIKSLKKEHGVYEIADFLEEDYLGDEIRLRVENIYPTNVKISTDQQTEVGLYGLISPEEFNISEGSIQNFDKNVYIFDNEKIQEILKDYSLLTSKQKEITNFLVEGLVNEREISMLNGENFENDEIITIENGIVVEVSSIEMIEKAY